MHSLGVCFTVTESVDVTVSSRSSSENTEVVLNGEVVQFAPVISVVRDLLGPESAQVKVAIETKLPLGCGFGVSGASSLATAFALNELFGLQRTRLELGMVAHCAEVEHLTGLGDVCGQYHGGCILRLTRHQPLVAHRVTVEPRQIFVRSFGPLATDVILKDEVTRVAINKAGDLALSKLLDFSDGRLMTLNELISISREFAEQSTLIRNAQVRQTLLDIDREGGVGSMIMLGNGVFSDIPFEGSRSMQIGGQGVAVLSEVQA
jgi:pantoate kinase